MMDYVDDVHYPCADNEACDNDTAAKMMTTHAQTLEALTSKQSHLLYSLPPKQNNVAIILSSVSVCFFCVAKQKYTHFGCRRQLTDDAF